MTVRPTDLAAGSWPIIAILLLMSLSRVLYKTSRARYVPLGQGVNWLIYDIANVPGCICRRLMSEA